MIALLMTLAACLPFTVDAITGSIARVETGCGFMYVAAVPWLQEGMTTAPWRESMLADRRNRIRRLPEPCIVLVIPTDTNSITSVLCPSEGESE